MEEGTKYMKSAFPHLAGVANDVQESLKYLWGIWFE